MCVGVGGGCPGGGRRAGDGGGRRGWALITMSLRL